MLKIQNRENDIDLGMFHQYFPSIEVKNKDEFCLKVESEQQVNESVMDKQFPVANFRQTLQVQTNSRRKP
jgi:hypothetical protein